MRNLSQQLVTAAELVGRHEAERDWCRNNVHRHDRLKSVAAEADNAAYYWRERTEKLVLNALAADGPVRAKRVHNSVKRWLEMGRSTVDQAAVAEDMEHMFANRLPEWQATDAALTPPERGQHGEGARP